MQSALHPGSWIYQTLFVLISYSLLSSIPLFSLICGRSDNLRRFGGFIPGVRPENQQLITKITC